MNNERYWIDRANYLIYHHMTDAEQVADEIAILYRKASKWLIYEARKIFYRYQNSHGLTEPEARRLISQLQDSSSLEELKRLLAQDGRNREILAQLDAPAYQYRIDRLQQIQNQLDIVMKNVYQQEKILAGDFFVDLANDSYYRQIYEIQHNTSYAFSFAHIDRKQIDKVISMPWSGKHYSERLWKNSRTLTKAIKEELLIDLVTGRPENEAVKIIANKFNQGIFETRRLVRTEAAFVSGELNAEAYKECDLQKYRFLATLDLRTSKICQSLDGKIFFLKDRQVGKNYPPMHPWCRSTTIAFVSQDDLNNLKRRAFNPKTGRTELVPASMTYVEWYEKYVKGDPNAEAQEKMLKNRSADKKQFEEYRGILGKDMPKNFAEFQNLKYNELERWEKLKKQVSTYRQIEQKEWTDEFKQKAKTAYKKFEKDGIYLSTHALSRLPRLNKSGYVSIDETDVKQLLGSSPRYRENDIKIAYFSDEKQLAIIKNTETDDVVTIVRTKKPKGDWENV